MLSFDPIELESLASVTGGRNRGGLCPPMGMYQNHGYSYAYHWGASGGQQQQVAQAPAPKGPPDVTVQTASGYGAQAPAGMMQDMGIG